MKTKFLGSMLLLASTMMMAPNAGAFSVYDPDTFLFSELLGNSAEDTERQALATHLNVSLDDVSFVGKSDSPVAYINGLDSWYIDIETTPGYFALKFGVGSWPEGTHDTYFFKNIEDLTKLVWTNEDVNYLTWTDVGRLSHYTLFDADEGGGSGGGGEAPEPAMMALMGIGFLSLAMSYARRVTS